MKIKGKAGFNLTELMVVLAILLILMTLFMPLFHQMRVKANEVACAVQLRELLAATLYYAAENNGRLPDLGRNGPDGVMSRRPYWSWDYWRDLLENDYGVTRRHWYSPSNPRWNRDDFYGWPGDYFVMGRFYFASDQCVDEWWISRLINPPPDLFDPIFPVRFGMGRSYWRIVWTDLNRQWPAGPGDNWVSPGDPNRWGANHLHPGENWPRGSHAAFENGSVQWVDGDQIIQRITPLGAEVYW